MIKENRGSLLLYVVISMAVFALIYSTMMKSRAPHFGLAKRGEVMNRLLRECSENMSNSFINLYNAESSSDFGGDGPSGAKFAVKTKELRYFYANYAAFRFSPEAKTKWTKLMEKMHSLGIPAKEGDVTEVEYRNMEAVADFYAEFKSFLSEASDHGYNFDFVPYERKERKQSY